MKGRSIQHVCRNRDTRQYQACLTGQLIGVQCQMPCEFSGDAVCFTCRFWALAGDNCTAGVDCTERFASIERGPRCREFVTPNLRQTECRWRNAKAIQALISRWFKMGAGSPWATSLFQPVSSPRRRLCFRLVEAAQKPVKLNVGHLACAGGLGQPELWLRAENYKPCSGCKERWCHHHVVLLI